MPKKVFVSGCFDLLHSGHIAFFQEASKYGDLYVGIGSDRTIFELKGRTPVNSEQERCYMIRSLACVKDAVISHGSGMLDFVDEMLAIQPDVFIVNEDGNTPDKHKLCQEYGIEYLVLKRTPEPGLAPRSTTDLRSLCSIPYRIDLAGGWLDQPFVSRHYPGPVITVGIEPTIEFNERSGMATSTRRKAIDLWGPRMPAGNREKLAKVLFCYDNPPGTNEISGSQDAIGLVYPCLARADYDGKYWPEKITHLRDELIMQFVENSLNLIPLGPRHFGYAVLSNTSISPDGARALSEAADACWHSLLACDVAGFGRHLRESFEAQIAMFPNMVNETVHELIDEYRLHRPRTASSPAPGG